MIDPMTLPDDLPHPKDDGAADHLPGELMPSITLPTTDGAALALSALGHEVSAVLVETIEGGDSALVMLHLVGRGVGSRIELDETDAHVFTFGAGGLLAGATQRAPRSPRSRRAVGVERPQRTRARQSPRTLERTYRTRDGPARPLQPDPAGAGGDRGGTPVRDRRAEAGMPQLLSVCRRHGAYMSALCGYRFGAEDRKVMAHEVAKRKRRARRRAYTRSRRLNESQEGRRVIAVGSGFPILVPSNANRSGADS